MNILQKIKKYFNRKPQAVQVKKPEPEVVEKAVEKKYTAPKRKSKENNYKSYKYYADRLYFKTWTGKRPIRITALESIKIITLHRQGFHYTQIYTRMSFHHEISDKTVKHFIEQYEKGLMNKALKFICSAHIDGINVPIKDVIKR